MAKTRQLSNQTAIVGLGTKIIGKDGPKISTLQLEVYACHAAMKNAGIDRTQIGAVFTGRAPAGFTALQWNMRIINELKVVPKMSSEITVHGAGVFGTLQYAALVVNAGILDYAICCSGDMAAMWIDLVKVNAANEGDMQFEVPYGPTTPSLYAQWATRYMYEFNVKPEDMAKVAVENRKWALHHPNAAMREKGPITIEDVLNSRPIALPLRLLDCSAWYRGGFGTAVIVTRSELAKKEQKPIFISGFGQCSTHEWITERMGLFGIEPSMTPNLTVTGAKVAAEDAYEMAGWTPRDVDLVETSAPFTFANLMMLEDLGFCKKGDAARFVREGGIDFEGGLPFNTNGGYLSFGQAIHGMYMAAEAIEQLRGEAKGKQVAGAKHGLVHFHGGPFGTHSVMLLSNQEGL